MARTASGTRTAATHTNTIIQSGTFETAPSVLTAQTSTAARWIDGTAAGSQAKSAFGWSIISVTASAAAGFDNTVSNSGTYSLKLSTLNSSGIVTAGSYRTNSPTAASLFELFPMAASTSYTLTVYVKTNNVAGSAAYIECREFSASGVAGVTNTSSKLSGTNNFTKITKVFTTASTCVFGGIFLRNNVTGNVGDAWFDDILLVPTAGLSRSASGTRTLV